jgi:hypothetical protein
VKRLRQFHTLEAWGFDQNLKGIPIVKAPLIALAMAVKRGDITQAQHDGILAPLKELIDVHSRNPEMGLMIDSQTWQSSDEAMRPSGMPQFDVGLLDGGTYSLEEIAAAIIRINQEIARLLGIEHLLLGSDGVGSLALAKDKSDNFALMVDSTLREIKVTMNRDYLGPLWEVNGWPEDLKPTLEHEKITNRDIARIGDALGALVKSGVQFSRHDRAVTEFLELIGFSPLDKLEDIDPEMAERLRVKDGLQQSADNAATSAAQIEMAEAGQPEPQEDE